MSVAQFPRAAGTSETVRSARPYTAIMQLSEDGRLETVHDCTEPPEPPSGCSGPCKLCTIGCPDGACYWWCDCGDHKVLVDSYGNPVGESRPADRAGANPAPSPSISVASELRPEDVDAAGLIRTTTASLEPSGKWIAFRRGSTRIVSGTAKSATGREYTVVFELAGTDTKPSVKSSRIYRQEVALVVRRVTPGAVQ